MNAAPLIVFRTDYSEKNQDKHVQRSLILAELFIALGWQCLFIIEESTLEICKFIQNYNVNIILTKNFNVFHDNFFCDLLIVDHDSDTLHFEQTWKTKSKEILVISESPSNPHDCDILIDANPIRDSTHYQGLIPKTSKLLLGPRFSFINWDNSHFDKVNKAAILNLLREWLGVADAENKSQLSLVLAEYQDIKLIFDWQQDPIIRKYARNPKPPSWEEHLKWFEKCYKNKECYLLIIKYNGAPAGVLRLDKIISPANHFGLSSSSTEVGDVPAYEVSILISTEMQHQGIALKALKHARVIFPNIEIWAEILPDNSKSILLFQKAEYLSVQNGILVNKPIF